jgi:endonuclease/exonuclease/phosphatase family metal-dependent hydrolase
MVGWNNGVRVSLIITVLCAGCSDGGPSVVADGSVTGDAAEPSSLAGGGLRVMTLNMYLGASVASLTNVPLLEIPLRVGDLWSAVRGSVVEQRVERMADAIARLAPHVVGLQEAVLVREQVPGDYLEGNPVAARAVVWDFLELLLAALADREARYEVAVEQQNADIEAPRLLSGEELGDARLTDRDVILVQSGMAFSRPAKRIFDTVLAVDPVEIERGYVALSVDYEGRSYRLVNTHLEAADEGPAIRIPQARQLVDELSTEDGPLILLGDINSAAPDGGAYRVIRAGGYRDAWTDGATTSTGATCCQVADLRGEGTLSRRIDVILTRNLSLTEVEVVTALDREAERTPDGLWPTDHAAVAARLAP